MGGQSTSQAAGGSAAEWSLNAEVRMSALPLEKVVSWIVGHGDVPKLWWQGERGPVLGLADGHTDRCRVRCASFYKLVALVTALLLVDSSGRRYDLGMAAPPLCTFDPALRSGALHVARSRFNGPIEPMDLANMRANGVRSLLIFCRNCHHEKILNVDHSPKKQSALSTGMPTRARSGRRRLGAPRSRPSGPQESLSWGSLREPMALSVALGPRLRAAFARQGGGLDHEAAVPSQPQKGSVCRKRAKAAFAVFIAAARRASSRPETIPAAKAHKLLLALPGLR
jgi:hypothetical protein